MKRILFYIAAAALGVMSVVSCTPKEKNFDETFLYSGSGEWSFTRDDGQGDNVIEHKFNSDHTGYEINITLEQDEPQTFDWSLSGERLSFIHHMTMGGDIPEDCIVDALTGTSLIYINEDGERIVCTKKP